VAALIYKIRYFLMLLRIAAQRRRAGEGHLLIGDLKEVMAEISARRESMGMQ
jgi:hypothetical protein